MTSRFIVIVSASALACAQPQVSDGGIRNAASSAPPAFPNGSIAQGSIFSIYGSNLGPTSSPAQSYPLQPTLGGVAVQVTSESVTLNAIPIFVSPNLINAILPDNTPAGPATLAVTFGGQASNAALFQVIGSSFGIFTTDSSGWGPGVITGTNYQLYSVSAPANAGDVAVLWGTGIGASPGDDGSAPPPQIDMASLPLTVYVGTQPTTVLYRGRTGFTGEDQINFVVPAGIIGCYVPVAVEIENIPSNFATMPIAPAGLPCPDPTPPIPPLNVLFPSGAFAPTGNISLERSVMIGDTTVTTDYGFAFFGAPQIQQFPYIPPFVGNPYALPIGTCTGGVTFPSTFDVLSGPMAAGTITIAGPTGTAELVAAPDPFTYLSQVLGGGAAPNTEPLFLNPGAYTISGNGATFSPETGPGVGPFSQNILISTPLAWTNQDSISTVLRSQPLDVTWSGGDPNGTVQITAYNGEGFICNARTSDQHFTIPAFVLSSFPTDPNGQLRLSTQTTTQFTASGIASGAIVAIVTIAKNVSYQ
jgi:uncharacterized protein (TIGR03437 family)